MKIPALLAVLVLASGAALAAGNAVGTSNASNDRTSTSAEASGAQSDTLTAKTKRGAHKAGAAMKKAGHKVAAATRRMLHRDGTNNTASSGKSESATRSMGAPSHSTSKP